MIRCCVHYTLRSSLDSLGECISLRCLRKSIADDLECREGIDNDMQDEFTGAVGDEPVLSIIFSMIFTTLVCVIALNALIQYMGESVAAVTKEKDAELIRQRAGLLVELITLGTGWCSCKERLDENEKAHAWVHCLVPKEMEEAKLNAIQHEFTNQEERLTKLMEEKLGKTEEKVGALLLSSQQRQMTHRPVLSSHEQIDGKLSLGPARESELTVDVAPTDVSQTQLTQLEETIIARLKTSEETSLAQFTQLEKIVTRLDAKLSALSDAHLESKIGSIGASRANVGRATPPGSSAALIGTIPEEIRQQLDRIESDRLNGRREAAQSQYEDLMKRCVPEHVGVRRACYTSHMLSKLLSKCLMYDDRLGKYERAGKERKAAKLQAQLAHCRALISDEVKSGRGN